MTETPMVSPREREVQIASLYEKIGRIAVQAEHLNNSMNMCCLLYLERKGLPQTYGNTVLAGRNLEPMRRMWTALMKEEYSGNSAANKIIEDLSTRIDNANRHRNEIIHRIWFIGWGNEQTETFEKAASMKFKLDNRGGGVKISERDTSDFETVIEELRLLTEMVRRVMGCCVIQGRQTGHGKLENNFHYVDGKLKPGTDPSEPAPKLAPNG